MPEQSNIKQIKAIIDTFKIERIAYLAITVISLIILLYLIFFKLMNEVAPLTVAALFVPSGSIAYTSGRLLKMFSISMNVLVAMSTGKEVKKDDE